MKLAAEREHRRRGCTTAPGTLRQQSQESPMRDAGVVKGFSFTGASDKRAPMITLTLNAPGRTLRDQAKNGCGAPFAPFCSITEIHLPMSSSDMFRPNSFFKTDRNSCSSLRKRRSTSPDA